MLRTKNSFGPKLQRVLRDGSLVHAYRNRAQTRVKQKYDWEYVVDRYEELFARMQTVLANARISLGNRIGCASDARKIVEPISLGVNMPL